MSRKTLRPDSRRSLTVTTAASAAALLLVALAGSPAAAAPTVHASVADGTLRILGSPAPDQITLRLDKHDPSQLQVDVGDDGTRTSNSVWTPSARSTSRPATATTPSGSMSGSARSRRASPPGSMAATATTT